MKGAWHQERDVRQYPLDHYLELAQQVQETGGPTLPRVC